MFPEKTKEVWFISFLDQLKKRQLQHHHNDLHSHISNIEIVRNVFTYWMSSLVFETRSRFFPKHNVEGLLFSWPWPWMSSVLYFLIFDPLGKTAAVVFVTFSYCLANDPFLSPLVRLFLIFFVKIIEIHHFFSYFFVPWQETIADARDGDEEGGGPFGTILIQFWKMLEPFWINFKTILGSLVSKNHLFFNQEWISLKWHIQTSSPLFDEDHPSP